MVENFCSSKFKEVPTEELLEVYADHAPNLPFMGISAMRLRAEIRDEVFARFSERMRQLGMLEFMVELEERWQARPRRRWRWVDANGVEIDREALIQPREIL